MKCYNFARIIKAFRILEGLTIEEEAALFGVKKSRVSMWECGSLPRWEILFKIADYYQVSIDFLLGHDTKVQDDKHKAWIVL